MGFFSWGGRCGMAVLKLEYWDWDFLGDEGYGIRFFGSEFWNQCVWIRVAGFSSLESDVGDRVFRCVQASL